RTDCTWPVDFHAAYWNLGVGGVIDLATLGGSASQALSINAGGQMVGLSTTTGQQRKFASLYTDSKVVNLGVLGDAESKGLRMNRRRQIGALWFSGKVA